MNAYQFRALELKLLMCTFCAGSGEQNDISFGDITFNTWECPACKGTGFVNAENYNLTKEEEEK